ncbi:MAG TPA: NAD(P)/FAD-dependent oxidoreductase [Gammaproteobacteria bacterium]|nr:NAD(P)/FAD-dependent oxidoreductase [Gammaproteobacteria bacterium]
MKDRFDVVVVGGGHNGLVCAAYLAAAKLSVCVLERHTRVGGAAVTEEFHPGFRNSMASYTVSLLRRKIIDDLGLERHGLKIVPRPLANFVPSLDGPGLELPRGHDAAQRSIARHSLRDAERFPRYAADLSALARLFRSLWFESPVDPSGGPRETARMLARLPRIARLGGRGASALWDLLAGSAGHTLDRWFETDLLKGGLGFDSIVGRFASPYRPGSGYLLLHHALGEIDGDEGAWGHAIGGMGAISDALEACARERGVEIVCEASVERIEADERGCEVASGGRVLRSRAVAAGVHPRLLFERLLDPARLPEEFRTRIRQWRSESASFRANVALAELPDFACLPGRAAAPHHGSGILIAPGLGYLDAAHSDAERLGFSRAPVVELVIPSTLDPTLAPEGAHVASLFCQHFRRRLPNGEPWSKQRDAALGTVIDTVSAYAPNFRSAVIAAQAYTPEDLEQRFGLVDGDIFHGALDLDQIYWARPAWGYAQYRTPVRRVYLCGSGAHPGGGVSGAPGHNAAREICRDLARSR